MRAMVAQLKSDSEDLQQVSLVWPVCVMSLKRQHLLMRTVCLHTRNCHIHNMKVLYLSCRVF